MCLGIPGQIVQITDESRLLARADISGVQREVNVCCIADGPLETLIGRYALIHVGFAMALIDEDEAARTLEALEGLGEAQETLEAMEEGQVTVEGETRALIGPNGSCKTTAVNLITGFVKPTEGEVRFRGKNISGWPPYKIVRLGIARTFQMVKPFYQLPAYKNMIIPLYSPRVKKIIGGKYGDRDAVALDLLEEVGFERDAFVAYKVASVLPQGYLKRLELAKAIALQPDLIILDELFSGLSLAEVASIVPIIEKLRQQGKTIIMIEHRLKELFRIADRVIVMYAGFIVEESSVKDLYADPRHPYTIGLLHSLPRLDEERGRRLASIEGLPPDLIALPEGCPFYARCDYRVDKCQTENPQLEPVAPNHKVSCWVDVTTAKPSG